jgi:glycosyltransferase involved in cell wall biosynthesis
LAQKIRVLFAIGEMSGGGSQRQMIGILQRLDRSRFEPQLYLVTPGGELLSEVPADVSIHVFAQRCRRPGWTYPGQAHRARIRDLAEILRKEKIDVVYDRTYHMTLVTASAVRRRPTPRVSVIVTDPLRDFETNVERFRFLKRLLLRRAYQTADRVVAVSEGVRQAATEHYALPPEKAVTIYNFFDIERIDRLMIEPLPAGESRDTNRFEIVAAGRLHPQKGFLVLLAAIRDLLQNRGRRQIHLRILGTGDQQGALSDYVAGHGLQSNVTLAGFRTNPLPYFRQADLFCLSSLYEGMPNALVEAMLCRVPVVATDCPSGPSEVLDGGHFGRLVPPADARALADAIEDTMDHADVWRGRVPAARSHIEKTFSPEKSLRQLEDLLIELAGTKPGPGATGSKFALG